MSEMSGSCPNPGDVLMRARLRTRLLAAALLAPAIVAAVSTSRPPAAPVAAPVETAVTDTFARTPSAGELGIPETPDDGALLAQRGTVPPGAFDRARKQSLRVRARTAVTNPAVAAQDWELAGPTNIGGRILDIVVDPDAADTIFVLTASGGVWKSSDAGKTFAASWPADLTQAMGAMAMGPDGTLYVGTGEAGPGGGSITYAGNGVYRSTDKGVTWEHIGLETSARIGRIAVDPTNPDRVFVAATGNLYVPGGERGLFRSLDGGDTWDLVAEGANDKTGAVDVAIDPNNPDNVLVAMWENFRTPSRRYYTGAGSGVYRSTDGGDTFSAAGLAALTPGNPEQGRIGIAYAPGTEDKVYAYTSTEVGAYAGFYTSTDGGGTFTGLGVGIDLVTGSFVYGWWFGRLYVDPKDDNHVFATGVNLSETTDGGVNWGSAPAGHSDHHAMAWDPKVDDRVYVGNDGGVYRSDDNGANFEFGEYQPFSQLYSIDVDEADEARLVAGLQDNGVNRSWDADDESSANGWTSYVGGDGEAAVINPQDGQVLYGCSQYGACSVSFDGGNTSQGVQYNGEPCAPLAGCPRANWFSPIVLDPADPSIVYTGHFSLFKSTDAGRNFERHSSTLDFSNGPPPTESEPNPLFRHYATITTIATTDSDRGIMLVGTDDGNLWRSSDAGATFAKMASDVFVPGEYVTRAAIDLVDPLKMYATFSGYRSGDNAAYVVASVDGGDTWTNISGNLPEAPVNDIVIVGDALVVATDVGVFLTNDKGATWLAVGDNLPMAPITDIRYHSKSNRIFAASFGRSAWSTAYPGTRVPVPVFPRPGGNNGGGNPRPGGGGTTPSTGGSPVVPTAGMVLVALGAAVALRRRRSRAETA
jgi:MYXO-CTERM domain-containing protein